MHHVGKAKVVYVAANPRCPPLSHIWCFPIDRLAPLGLHHNHDGDVLFGVIVALVNLGDKLSITSTSSHTMPHNDELFLD
jgi:hypothetical protein